MFYNASRCNQGSRPFATARHKSENSFSTGQLGLIIISRWELPGLLRYSKMDMLRERDVVFMEKSEYASAPAYSVQSAAMIGQYNNIIIISTHGRYAYLPLIE